MANYVEYLESLSKKQLMVMLARQRQKEEQGIAVIGMGCRYPGGIEDPEGFWAALRAGRVVQMKSLAGPSDSLGRPRWNLDAPELSPLAELLRRGAYLPDVDLFDAEYFGISDEEAVSMDPQQRLLLEVTVQALADANLTRTELRGQRVGVFMALGTVEYPWLWFGRGADATSPHSTAGTVSSGASGRIGWILGANGPAMSIDTSSSSVLAAAHAAEHALRRRECDLALIGACQLLLWPFSTAALAKAGMLSPSGQSRPFTEAADGHVRAEGCGVLVLKRQQSALADGDHIYAIIRGSALYQHGERVGLAAISAAGQRAVIDLALRAAKVEPHEVQYVEAQANGSRLGGVVEAETLADVYCRNTPVAPPLYVGSCKANLGYLEAASGAPALMKTALALAHAEIPPQVAVDNLDPTIQWGRTSLRLAREPVAWPSGARRLAAVSAFGLTGINAHVVLEGAPSAKDAELGAPVGPALLVVSAHNDAALAATADRLCRHLEQRPKWSHAAVCRTLAEGRDQHEFRSASVVHDGAELLDHLRRTARQELSAAPASDRGGLLLEIEELSPTHLQAALKLARQSGFAALDARIRMHCDKLGLAVPDDVSLAEESALRGLELAWALGWLEWLMALGVQIAGATLEGTNRRALADVILGRTQLESAVRVGLERADDVLSIPTRVAGWETAARGEVWTLRRSGTKANVSARLAALDARGLLELLAGQFRAGAALNLKALSTEPRRGLCRLPGPALTGRSFWPTPLQSPTANRVESTHAFPESADRR